MVYDGCCGPYYNRTGAVLPNFYLLDARDSHLTEFWIDAPASAGRGPCVRHPTVLNNTLLLQQTKAAPASLVSERQRVEEELPTALTLPARNFT